MTYADVIVDLSAQAVDKTFTYRLPDALGAGPGFQVKVPFGPRTVEGFIVGVRDRCDLPDEKLKSVKECVHPWPVILPELMELADEISRRCLCNRVDALRLMIPAEMRGARVREKRRKIARRLCAPEAARAWIDRNPRARAQGAILQKLLDAPCLDASTLPRAPLQALTEKGLVAVEDAPVRRAPRIDSDDAHRRDPELTGEQTAAVEEMGRALDAGGGRYLLRGVTGSGKTEVYIRLIRKCLELGRSAIVLVPEIALTPQMVSWLHSRFGASAAVLHSALSAGEKYDEWRRIRSGEARVVIGARSAIFAPCEHLGVIVVDEEHESSYQSDRRPRYDARDVAWMRARKNRAVLILGSATPSIATYMRAMPGVRAENRLTLIELHHRATGRPLPQVEVVDMRSELQRGNASVFSGKLHRALGDCLSAGRQAILFLNRRGHSAFVSCRACGKVIHCANCAVSMTYHARENMLKCHYCGLEIPPPKVCPNCGSRYIKYFGTGTEKVEQEVQRAFPAARTVRMDVDTTRGKDAHAKLLSAFRSGEANILIGTQMIAKGLDFPNVTLVGVVAADLSLHVPDYRSAEKTFQLLTQVAGRAGRAENPGRVIVQTYDPDHYAVQLAARQDYRAFYFKESAYRRKALYPPFTRILRTVYTAADPRSAEAAAQRDAEALDAFLDARGFRRDIVQMRALEAPIGLLRGEYRWQIFLKMYFKGDVQAVADRMRRLAEAACGEVRAEFEIDPVNLF